MGEGAGLSAVETAERTGVEVVDLATTPLRELNRRLHELSGEADELAHHQPERSPCDRVRSRRRDRRGDSTGHVGYYCAGMNKLATVRVHGNAGPGLAENLMSGAVLVDGSASQSAGATGRGGLLVGARRRVRSLRHLDEGHRHRRAGLGRPPERFHGADAAASSSAAMRARRWATRSTRRGSTCAARWPGSARTASRRSCATSTSPRCPTCSRGRAWTVSIASEFRRYGSARQLYNFKVDNAAAY